MYTASTNSLNSHALTQLSNSLNNIFSIPPKNYNPNQYYQAQQYYQPPPAQYYNQPPPQYHPQYYSNAPYYPTNGGYAYSPMYTGTSNTYYSAPAPAPISAAAPAGPIINSDQFTKALDSLKKLQGLLEPATSTSSWLDEIQSFLKTNSHPSACGDPFANTQFPSLLKSTGNDFIATLAATPSHTSDYFLQFPVPSTVAQYLFNCVNKVDNKTPLYSLELTVLHKPDKLKRGPQFYYDFNNEQLDRYVYLYATGSWSQLNIVVESLSFFIDSVRRVTALSSTNNNPSSLSIFSDVQVIELVWDDFVQYVFERKQWYQFDLENNDYSMKVQPEQVTTAADSSYSMLFYANAKLIQDNEGLKPQFFGNRFIPQVLLKANAKSVQVKQCTTTTTALPVWVRQWCERELGCSSPVDLLLVRLPIPNILSVRKLFSAEKDIDQHHITIELLKSMCVLKVPEERVISHRHDLSLLSRFFYIEIEVAYCDLYKCLQLLSIIVQMMQTSEINTTRGSEDHFTMESLLFYLHKWMCSVTSNDLGSVFPTKMIIYNGSMGKQRQKHPLQESYIENAVDNVKSEIISCIVHLKLSCEKHSCVIQHLLANNSQQLQSLCDAASDIQVELHLDTENSTLYWLDVLFSSNRNWAQIVLAVHQRISQLAEYNTVSVHETKQSHPKPENELSLLNKKQKLTHRYH